MSLSSRKSIQKRKRQFESPESETSSVDSDDFCSLPRDDGNVRCIKCTKLFNISCLDQFLESEPNTVRESICNICKTRTKLAKKSNFKITLAKLEPHITNHDIYYVKEFKITNKMLGETNDEHTTCKSNKALDPKINTCVLIEDELNAGKSEEKDKCFDKRKHRRHPSGAQGSPKSRSKKNKYKTSKSDKCYECRKGLGKKPVVTCKQCTKHFHYNCAGLSLTDCPSAEWSCRYHTESSLEPEEDEVEIPSPSQSVHAASVSQSLVPASNTDLSIPNVDETLLTLTSDQTLWLECILGFHKDAVVLLRPIAYNRETAGEITDGGSDIHERISRIESDIDYVMDRLANSREIRPALDAANFSAQTLIKILAFQRIMQIINRNNTATQ